jgi:esterase/lipase superfamily enzyme
MERDTTMRWLITNRNLTKTGFGIEFVWLHDKLTANTWDWSAWSQVTKDAFKAALVTAADQFPPPLTTSLDQQKQVTLLIHGCNNAWDAAMRLHDRVERNLYSGANSLGELVSFDWPSKGSLLGYLPDRSEARQSAEDLSEVLSELYDWLSVKQAQAAKNPQDACKAKTSLIAHSMGNYVLECAMNYTWTQKNRPLLVSLLQEVLMVAADVDNDIFRSGETVEHGDGEGIANLCYRVTALYTGRDAVLGSSAGLKHFGKRRLGRSGLDRTCPVPDNVWDVDCSALLNPKVDGMAIHGEYFADGEKAYGLMREILLGVDRSVLIAEGQVPAANPRQQTVSSGPPGTS